jgi:hypothetical protein
MLTTPFQWHSLHSVDPSHLSPTFLQSTYSSTVGLLGLTQKEVNEVDKFFYLGSVLEEDGKIQNEMKELGRLQNVVI